MKANYKQLTKKVKPSIHSQRCSLIEEKEFAYCSFAEAFRLLRESSEDENTTRLFKRLKIMVRGR